MTNIAWKNLSGERTRFAISVAGVAFSVVLVITLRALYWGVIDEATRYVRTTGADLWVAQDGSPGDFIQARSVLPVTFGARIEAVPGVADAAPLLSRPVGFRLGQKDTDLFLLGVGPVGRAGWPEAVVDGDVAPPPRGSVVIDRVFAKNSGVGVGDVLPIGRGLRVAAVVGGGNAFAYQFAWANLDDVASLVGVEGFVSYFLVRTAPGESAAIVGQRIQRDVSGTVVFAGTELADRNADNLREGFLPVLWVLVIVAFVVGTIIIGLIIYTATLEKSKEYGVLKAIGFSNRRLYSIVFQQSLLAATAGFLLGWLLSVALGPVIEGIVPVFVTDIRPGDVIFAGVGALAMAVLASFIPARPVARLDPAQVFRA